MRKAVPTLIAEKAESTERSVVPAKTLWRNAASVKKTMNFVVPVFLFPTLVLPQRPAAIVLYLLPANSTYELVLEATNDQEGTLPAAGGNNGGISFTECRLVAVAASLVTLIDFDRALVMFHAQ